MMAPRLSPAGSSGATGGGSAGAGGEGKGGVNGDGMNGCGGEGEGGDTGGGMNGGGGKGGEGGGAEGGALSLLTATLTSDADIVIDCPVAFVMASLIALKSMDSAMLSRPDVELVKSEND